MTSTPKRAADVPRLMSRCHAAETMLENVCFRVRRAVQKSLAARSRTRRGLDRSDQRVSCRACSKTRKAVTGICRSRDRVRRCETATQRGRFYGGVAGSVDTCCPCRSEVLESTFRSCTGANVASLLDLTCRCNRSSDAWIRTSRRYGPKKRGPRRPSLKTVHLRNGKLSN